MAEIDLYDIAKILHIISVISWMAGLLYLPRIFVYHAGVKKNGEIDRMFQVMEDRLYKYIMTPAMILTLIFGFFMASEIGFDFVWLHIKLTLVFLLIGFHHMLGKWKKDFAKGENKNSEKFFRIANEVPTILMILIVIFIILKPF